MGGVLSPPTYTEGLQDRTKDIEFTKLAQLWEQESLQLEWLVPGAEESPILKLTETPSVYLPLHSPGPGWGDPWTHPLGHRSLFSYYIPREEKGTQTKKDSKIFDFCPEMVQEPQLPNGQQSLGHRARASCTGAQGPPC